MTGNVFLDWAVMAVSLFNTILLSWLGMTVLLNAEHRTWGIWMVGGGMLMGGAFFFSHSALLGHGLYHASGGLNFWWRVGWVPVVVLPFAWYAVILWYAGFWEASRSRLRRRHQPWFVLAALLAVGFVGLILFANPLPSYFEIAQLRLLAAPSVGGVPVLILAYPAYILLCIGLSLDALRRPEPSARVMGDRARFRAHPWLVATSVVLLVVSLLVGWVLGWIVLNVHRSAPHYAAASMALAVARFDLAISSLIAVATVLVGQAIVSYEVFTGKALPRRGLFHHWRRAVILAAGYSVTVGGSLAFQLRPIYSLLLTTLLMVTFYALLAWRSYAERQRYITRLRPFVASQRLYERLLTPSAPIGIEAEDVESPFRALCEDVLGTRVAYLLALGPLAPLTGPPLTYPEGGTPPSPADLVARFDSPQAMGVPLDPARYGGATWAVPLWSERGLIGVLLLGEKRDGGLYTLEEMEIARITGERLIDTRASAEMARRLMVLQRQRLTQSRLLDQRTRRTLHDDVLPNLHAAMLTLSSEYPFSAVIPRLADVHRQIADLLREMPLAITPEVARLGPVSALRRVVEGDLGMDFDSVVWEVEPEAERKARDLSSLAAEVLFYAAREAIRNAARHGRGLSEERPLNLQIDVAWRGGINITLEDDGVGLAARHEPDEGSGQGLALHSTMMAVVGGALAVESVSGAYTRVVLSLPVEDL